MTEPLVYTKGAPQDVTPPSELVLTLFLRAHTTPSIHSTGAPKEERETSWNSAPSSPGSQSKVPESTSLIKTFYPCHRLQPLSPPIVLTAGVPTGSHRTAGTGWHCLLGEKALPACSGLCPIFLDISVCKPLSHLALHSVAPGR